MLHPHVVGVVQVVSYLRLEAGESRPARDVIHGHASVRIPEVRLRYRIESLLTCRVPQLQLHHVAVYLHLFYFEIDSYRAAL